MRAHMELFYEGKMEDKRSKFRMHGSEFGEDQFVFTPKQYSEIHNDSVFIRTKELQEFLDVFIRKPSGKYIIYGAPGMGKTTFLHMVGSELAKQGMKIVEIDIRMHRNGLSPRYDALIKEAIFLIDGLDEMYNSHYWIEEIHNKNLNCICTSRVKVQQMDFDYEFHLRGLTKEEISQLYYRRFGRFRLNDIEYEDLLGLLGDEKTPQNVLSLLSRNIIDKNLLEKLLHDIPEDIYQTYIYGKGLDIACPKILLPSHNKIVIPTEIKNDVEIVNKSLLDKVAKNPDILYSIQPREFEEMVCELFERKGYKVKLTKQTHDGGKDIIILNDSMLGDLIFYAECKRFSKNRPVDVSLVRELYGVVEADRATAGIMVTTSYYSEKAKEYRNKIKTRMQLIDYVELLREIRSESDGNIL